MVVYIEVVEEDSNEDFDVECKEFVALLEVTRDSDKLAEALLELVL